MIFENLDRIIFAGDSVTDMERKYPVGEGLFDSLGKGFVRIVESLLSACYPEIKLRITNSGCSGQTSNDLMERYNRDVMDLNPQWVSICIGINDVWRQFDCPAILEKAVTPEKYAENVEKMVVLAKEKCKGVFLMTPYYMEPNKDDMMRKRMDEYGVICKKIAEKHRVVFIDLQAMFDKYFKYRHSSYIAWDRVHPNQVGAVLIAKEFLKRCDFDFNKIVE